MNRFKVGDEVVVVNNDLDVKVGWEKLTDLGGVPLPNKTLKVVNTSYHNGYNLQVIVVEGNVRWYDSSRFALASDYSFKYKPNCIRFPTKRVKK